MTAHWVTHTADDGYHDYYLGQPGEARVRVYPQDGRDIDGRMVRFYEVHVRDATTRWKWRSDHASLAAAKKVAGAL